MTQRPEPEMTSTAAADWDNARLDQDNYITVPEFGVNPGDVSFEGFDMPIIRPGIALNFEQLHGLRHLLRCARICVRRDVQSIEKVNEFAGEGFRKFLISSTAMGAEIDAPQRSSFFYRAILTCIRSAALYPDPKGSMIVKDYSNKEEVDAELADWQASAGALFAAWFAGLAPPVDTLKQSILQATTARHAENRQMKAQVLEWYSKHGAEFSSKDEAAIAATNIVPVKFRTIRDWLKSAGN